MAELALGILGLIIPLLATTTRIASVTGDRSQQVPSQIENLHELLERMQQRLSRYESENRASDSTARARSSESPTKGIARDIKDCQCLLNDYYRVMTKRGPYVPVERFMWPINNGKKLEEYRMKINEIYTTELIPALLESIQDGQRNSPRAEMKHENHFPTRNSPPDTPPSTVPFPIITPPPQMNGDSAAPIQPHSPVSAVVKSSGEFVRIDRTTLVLGESVARDQRCLSFNEVEVISGGCLVISLRFMVIGADKLVEHRLPEGTFPFIEDATSLEVRFLERHAVTITDEFGIHVDYGISQPRYKFTNIKSRNKFRSLVYGRDLLGPGFEVDDITSFRGAERKSIAQSQVLQFWRRATWETCTVSITFLATPASSHRQTGDNPQFYHDELPIDDYETHAVIVNTQNSRKRRTVELRSRLHWGKGEWITFGDHKDAERFRRFFNEHRNNTPVPQLAPLSQTSTLTEEVGLFTTHLNADGTGQFTLLSA